jgi:hypothetical protein
VVGVLFPFLYILQGREVMIAKIQYSFSFFLLIYNRVELRMHCSAVQCGAVQCSAVQCGAVQCSAVMLCVLFIFHHVKLHFCMSGWVGCVLVSELLK